MITRERVLRSVRVVVGGSIEVQWVDRFSEPGRATIERSHRRAYREGEKDLFLNGDPGSGDPAVDNAESYISAAGWT